MILVIDGYNVLKQAFVPTFVDDRMRSDFIYKLGNYAKVKGHKVVLVFDGGPYDMNFKETINKVSVVYSGYRETADDFIKRYLRENKEKDILLISSDREITSIAEQCGCEWVSALEFYDRFKEFGRTFDLENVSRNKTEIFRTTQTSSQELDQLMQNASKSVETKSEDLVFLPKKRQSKAYKLSKKDSRRAKKIGKL
ncbi:MAG: hypothetical protein UR26_C0002G0119 [candidate division TM6 bacterium GW2011_GWF2_32_72]|nr:MAG: hypothetical protein UR26_C0002G0119 [candidate division TM6 bacterium GW2011_GWF2_32_72]